MKGQGRAPTDRLCNHSSRGTGTTAYPENGDDIVRAQRMAAHADIKNTRTCDRTGGQVTRDEPNRIEI